MIVLYTKNQPSNLVIDIYTFSLEFRVIIGSQKLIFELLLLLGFHIYVVVFVRSIEWSTNRERERERKNGLNGMKRVGKGGRMMLARTANNTQQQKVEIYIYMDWLDHFPFLNILKIRVTWYILSVNLITLITSL